MKRYAVYILIAFFTFSACSREADTKVYDAPQPAERPVYDFSAGPSANDRIAPQSIDDNLIEMLSYFNARFEAVLAEKADMYALLNKYAHIPPDETGKVIIVMFHNFVEEYEEGGDTKITTTLSDFRLLLERLYNEGYRTTSLKEFISGKIAVPRGTKPIIFTFDDGRPTQFNLIDNGDGTFSENTKTAVGVMERFYEEHPDFGLNGTFFLNLGFSGTFGTVGTLKQRVDALAEKGFEIESHTFNHVNLTKFKSKEEIMYEIGKNAKTLNEINGETMSILSLPYGNNVNEAFVECLEKGAYDGFEYKNIGIMLVGAEPAAPIYLKTSDRLRIRRVLANGMEPVDCDLDWWLARMGNMHVFVSDGNPNIITVPADKLDLIDTDRALATGNEIVILEEEPPESGS